MQLCTITRTLFPSIEPTPTAAPFFSPSVIPSPRPSVFPSYSPATIWNTMINNYFGVNAPLSAERSVYINIYTDAQHNVGSCQDWESFAFVELTRNLIDFTPTKLTMISTRFTNQDLNATELVCEGGHSATKDALNAIVNALTDSSSDRDDTFASFRCNNTVWKIGDCSSGLPAVCVNCSNPCLEADRDYTINCAGGITADALNIVILDYEPVVLPPEISFLSVVSEVKTSITAQMSFSETEGSVVCDARLSTLSFVPDNEYLISLRDKAEDIRYSRQNFTISNMEPSSTYRVFCGTYSAFGQEASVDKVVSATVETLCCRPLLITLATTSFMDNADYPSALAVDVGSSLPLELVVDISTTFSVTRFLSYSSAYPFSAGRLEFSNASLSTTASVAYMRQESGFYQISVQLSGASSYQYEAFFDIGDTIEVVSTFQEPTTPSLLSAIFSSDGTRVVVSFNALTDRGGYVNTVTDCSLLFNSQGLDAFTVCVWHSDSKISVFLSGDSSAGVGADITLRGGVIKAKCTVHDCSAWSYVSAQNVSIGANFFPSSPTISMSASTSLGPCDDLVLDISGSTGAGGRSWANVTWSLESFQANRSDILAFLDAHSSPSDVALPITVPARLLYAGYGYNFVLHMCNFLGACGRGSHYVSVGSVESVPVVTIASAKSMSVYRYNVLTLSGASFIYKCDGEAETTGINLEWSMYRNGVLQIADSLVSTSVNPNVFLLPKYSLTVGSTYELVLRAQHEISKKYSSTSVLLSVRAGEVVSKVNVASEFGLRVSESIHIDAGASYDEDVGDATGLAANLLFDFQCERTYPSYADDCDLNMVRAGSSLTMSVPNSNVSYVDHTFKITIFVSHSSDSRTSRSSVHMTILPDLAAAVTLSSGHGSVINPSDKLSLVGIVDFPADGVAAWSVDDASVNLDTISLSPVVKDLIMTGGGISRLTVSLVLPRNSLAERSSYVFKLTVSLNTGFNSSSAIIVQTNSPPIAGEFSVTPKTGVELNTTFIFAAFLWEDMDLNLPLTYEFAAYSPLVGGYSVFRSRLQSTSVSSQLAAGQSISNYEYNARVQVFDILDGRSTATGEVQVEPQSNITDAELSNALVNASATTLKETVHVVSGVINSVACGGASNCTELHRESCGSVANKCGLCLDGFYGESEPANTLCYVQNISSGRRLDVVTSAVACVSDSDCAEELLEECKVSTSLCGPRLKQCDAQCSTHGSCRYVSRYDDVDSAESTVSECSVLDSGCAAQCVCQNGYAGLSCEMTQADFESRQNVRELLLDSYKVLIASENPSRETVVSWLEGLAGVSSHSLYLSESSKAMLVSLCSSVLGIAKTLQMPYEDIQHIKNILSLTLQGGASSSLDSALSLLDEFGLLVLEDLEVGQNPTVVVNTNYRLTAFSVDGLRMSELPMGRSGLEIATGADAPKVLMPASTLSEPYKVLLSETLSSMQSNASDKGLYQSVPVIVSVDRPICDSSPSVNPACASNVTMLHFEFGEHVTDEAMSYSTTCQMGVQRNVSYSCPSGRNMTAHCNGTMDGVLISNCSTHEATSRCEAVSDFESEMDCRLLWFSAVETSCECTLPYSVNSSWKVEYISIASTVLINDTVTFLPSMPTDETHSSSSSSADIRSSMSLFVVIAFVVYILIAVIVSYHRHGGKDSEISSTMISTPQELIDDGLPGIFKSRPFLKRMFNELCLHHKWSSLLFPSSDGEASRRQLFSMFCMLCVVFFMNSLIHHLWTDSDQRHDVAAISLRAAGISIISAPLFVLIDATGRLFSRNLSNMSVTPAAGNALRNEYEEIKRTLNVALACDESSADDADFNKLDVIEDAALVVNEGDERSNVDDIILGDKIIEEIEQGTQFIDDESPTGDSVLGDRNEMNSVVINSGFSFKNLEKCDIRVREELLSFKLHSASLHDKMSRLLYLFLVDFLDDIDLTVMLSKDKRDHFPCGNVPRKLSMYFGWLLFFLVDLCLLGYTIAIALRASDSSHYSWCMTFLVWAVVDLVIINPLVVMWTHIVLPSYCYAGIKRVKATVVRLLVAPPENKGVDTFNAASHFFVSSRLASLLSDVESDAKDAVLKFSTICSREQFVDQGIVPRGTTVTSSAWGRVVRSTANMNPVIHDLLIAILVSVVVGVFVILLGRAYSSLPVVITSIICVIICIFGAIFMIGLLSSERNDSLSLTNKRWNSVQVPQQEDFYKSEGVFDPQYSNDDEFDENDENGTLDKETVCKLEGSVEYEEIYKI